MWFLGAINENTNIRVVGQGVVGSLTCDNHASDIIDVSVMLKGVTRNQDESQ